MDKPKLGQKITSSDRLFRNRTHDGEKTWIRQGDLSWSRPKPVTGIYAGSRTKQNGRTDYDEYASYWIKSGQVDVWLIIEKDRENPVFVLPEDCTANGFSQVNENADPGNPEFRENMIKINANFGMVSPDLEQVNVGTIPSDATGDTIRDAWMKVNRNFKALEGI